MDALGNVTGTPSVSGMYPVTFQVTDSLGVSNQVTVTYTISSTALNIATQPLPPPGKVGYAYSFTPFASGGTATASVASSSQTVGGDWEFVGTQYRTHFEPVTTALADLVFKGFPAVPPTASILGVSLTVSLVSQAVTTGVMSQVAFFQGGSSLGTIKTPNTPFNTTVTPQTYGGATDNFGAALNPRNHQ